jgi:hypothetical protein
VISRRILTWLVTAALVLPISLSIAVAAARLLAAMQDAAGAAVLDRVALALGIIWVLGLVSLVIALALALLTAPSHAQGDDVARCAERRERPDDASE